MMHGGACSASGPRYVNELALAWAGELFLASVSSVAIQSNWDDMQCLSIYLLNL